MTKQLEKAFAEACQLPAADQDALACWILAELATDRNWQDASSSSLDQLAGLGDEALREHREGRTMPLDPDEL